MTSLSNTHPCKNQHFGLPPNPTTLNHENPIRHQRLNSHHFILLPFFLSIPTRINSASSSDFAWFYLFFLPREKSGFSRLFRGIGRSRWSLPGHEQMAARTAAVADAADPNGTKGRFGMHRVVLMVTRNVRRKRRTKTARTWESERNIKPGHFGSRMANSLHRACSLEIPEDVLSVSRANSSLLPVPRTEPVVKRGVRQAVPEWERGRKYKTKTGIRVRSKIEKIIADFLFEKRIRFSYEPVVTVGGWRFRPDFYLPDHDVFYEHFGFGPEAEAYQRGAAAKIARYK